MTWDLYTALARAIAEKAGALNPAPQLVPATVRAFTPSGTRALPIAELHVHGDPDTQTIFAQVISGELDPGDITVVLFDPPEAAYCWGQAPPAVTDDWRVYAGANEGITATDTYTFDVDASMTSVHVVGTTAAYWETAVLEVARAGTAVHTTTLPTDGSPFDITTPTSVDFATDDDIQFRVVTTLDEAANYFTVDHIVATGAFPGPGGHTDGDYEIRVTYSQSGVDFHTQNFASPATDPLQVPWSVDVAADGPLTLDPFTGVTVTVVFIEKPDSADTLVWSTITVNGTYTGSVPAYFSINGVLEGPFENSDSVSVVYPVGETASTPVSISMGAAANVSVPEITAVEAFFDGVHANQVLVWPSGG